MVLIADMIVHKEGNEMKKITKKCTRWNYIINAFLEKFPEIKFTDEQYQDLEERISEYGGDQYQDGIDAMRED